MLGSGRGRVEQTTKELHFFTEGSCPIDKSTKLKIIFRVLQQVGMQFMHKIISLVKHELKMLSCCVVNFVVLD